MQVFVAMPFRTPFDPVYAAIRSVCRASGARVVRVDEVVVSGDIYLAIEREIARSDIVVADVTGDLDPRVANPNVTLEVGLARALRKSVILLTQSIDSLPFDLRTQRALQYRLSTDGLVDLEHRLHSILDSLLDRRRRRGAWGRRERSAAIEPFLVVGVDDSGSEVYRSPIDGRPMALVEGGPFVRRGDGRTIDVGTFLIDRFCVTNLDYARFLDATGHRPPHFWERSAGLAAEEPVVGVTAADAEAYAAWSGKSLPTSDEWEKAAGGTDGRTFPWGDGDPHPGRAAFRSLAGWGPCRPVPIGRAAAGASPYGCQEMAGNVWEWLADWREPGRTRLIAGGSFESEGWALGCASRYWAEAERPDSPSIGFRCAARAGSTG